MTNISHWNQSHFNDTQNKELCKSGRIKPEKHTSKKKNILKTFPDINLHWKQQKVHHTQIAYRFQNYATVEICLSDFQTSFSCNQPLRHILQHYVKQDEISVERQRYFWSSNTRFQLLMLWTLTTLDTMPSHIILCKKKKRVKAKCVKCESWSTFTKAPCRAQQLSCTFEMALVYILRIKLKRSIRSNKLFVSYTEPGWFNTTDKCLLLL